MSNNEGKTINGRIHSVSVTGSGGLKSQLLTLNLDTGDGFFVDDTVPSGLVAAMASVLQAALFINAAVDVHYVDTADGRKQLTWVLLHAPKQ